MSNFGFCHLSVIPVRENPSDLSQMTTQLLFGDVFEVLESKGNWLQIKNAYDDYIGWIDNKQQIGISAEEFLASRQTIFTNELAGSIISNKETYQVLPASSFPSNKAFGMGQFDFEPNVPLLPFSGNKIDKISSFALNYINAPYLWGGKSPYGIDCSGLTQNAYKMAGIKIKRDAAQQAEQGMTLSFLTEAEPGDLLFFENADGIIVHVGILLSQNKIIHASGKVRIDSIDHQGIFNEEKKSYSHTLRLIKTFRV